MVNAEAIDEETSVWYLAVDSAKIVLLQTIFESYEGVGIVRTLDKDRGLVCILSTPSNEQNVESLLASLHDVVAWKEVVPEERIREVLRDGDFSR